MNIGIITFHRARNYGAVLQSYAIQRFISESIPEVNAEIIDYRSKYIEEFYKPDIISGTLRHRVAVLFSRNKIKKRNAKFQAFIDRYIKLSPPCDMDSISQIEQYDKYIAGSDMIWHWHTMDGKIFFDKTYFLHFVDDPLKKFSYAASFGVDKLPDQYTNFYKEQLKDFSRISVRENSAVEIINQTIKKKAVCNIDPTLLFTSEEWKKIEKKPNQSGYVLLYEVGGISDKMRECAKKIANDKSIPLVILYSEYHFIQFLKEKNGHFGYSPEEFLGWFDNAEYIVTNSFHGTVFSIIYHKDLFVEINTWIKNNRAFELMESLGLEKNIIDNGLNLQQKIDWNYVDQKLDQFRSEAQNYLKSVIN